MVKVNFFDPADKHTEVDAPEGESLMRAAVANDVDGIVAECGGEMSCATCHVFIHEGWNSRLDPQSADEIDLLEATDSYDPETSRLSCQITLRDSLDGIDVHVAPGN